MISELALNQRKEICLEVARSPISETRLGKLDYSDSATAHISKPHPIVNGVVTHNMYRSKRNVSVKKYSLFKTLKMNLNYG